MLAATIVAALAAVWAAVKFILPTLAQRYQVTGREFGAWLVVVALTAVVVWLVASRRTNTNAAPTLRGPSKATVTSNGGVKPTVTITHQGPPTTYCVDGQLISLQDGSDNPAPAPFQCELQVGGRTGVMEATLNDGEWVNIILGSIESLYGGGVVDRRVIGHGLAVRRGKQSATLNIPGSVAFVELRVRPTPAPSEVVPTKRFRLAWVNHTVNHGTVTVTEEQPVPVRG